MDTACLASGRNGRVYRSRGRQRLHCFGSSGSSGRLVGWWGGRVGGGWVFLLPLQFFTSFVFFTLLVMCRSSSRPLVEAAIVFAVAVAVVEILDQRHRARNPRIAELNLHCAQYRLAAQQQICSPWCASSAKCLWLFLSDIYSDKKVHQKKTKKR